MAVDIVRYVDSESEEILDAVVSSIVPRPREMVTLGNNIYRTTDISYIVSRRLDDFLDRDDMVHIAVVTVIQHEFEDSPPSGIQVSVDPRIRHTGIPALS